MHNVTGGLMRFAGALVLILLVNEACASEPPRLCADPRGLSIHGVSLADNSSTLVAKLGEPKRVGSYEGEDDVVSIQARYWSTRSLRSTWTSCVASNELPALARVPVFLMV